MLRPCTETHVYKPGATPCDGKVAKRGTNKQTKGDSQPRMAKDAIALRLGESHCLAHVGGADLP
ncbi:peptidase domain protein [Methylocaldum marinum]|uniref:Peptidase domain protein n=1 Tax=Methylocaldum marinum TaxID=1432792 RepID=A0A250KP07_9GAMM|nr:peptidase domain protein [Methylocaldum marinum]